jgi:DNA-binding PadR family transcriptional regulator
MREDDSWRHHDEEARHRRGGGRRGGGHGGRQGPGGRPGFGVPPGMPWLGDPRMMRGPRAKRGDVRAAALALLADGPMNGYQIIQEISERSGDVWRPSPGSVYPALQQLEDEGLIRAEEGNGGRRAYVLTDDGREYAGTHAAELEAPWEAMAGNAGGSAAQMRTLIGQLAMAATQVLSAGTERQVADARKILTDSRRALYRLLAADDDAEDHPAAGEPGDAEPGSAEPGAPP